MLHYQPQLDLYTKNIIGMEALIRWRHPDMGMVSPAKFIPLAERTGLILPIGAWVLWQACQQNKIWRDAGLPWVRMAINLSARQFRRSDLVQQVAKALQDVDLEPDALEIELTESMLVDDVQVAIDTMRHLKSMGVSLSLDDFGTGYSSLSYLKRFPIDRLKIDQSFVRELPADADNAAIVDAVISMAHSMKLRVLAEGVETIEQLDYLSARLCDEAQGYHFARPLPAEEAAGLLQKQSDRLTGAAQGAGLV